MRLLLALVLLLAACTPTVTATPAATRTPAPRALPADSYIRTYGGLAGVYRTILEETGCAKLQDLFYTATDNSSTGYQSAINDRAFDLRCPDLRFTRP